MELLHHLATAIGDVLWHESVLYLILAVGVLFTLWSRFSQWRSITHGVAVTAGRFDDRDDPGAIRHFEALSAALSATVGLGNIGGVALGIGLGGPGAVFWMWVIGVVGMALKSAEVTLSMLYRDVEDPQQPKGGPMFVAERGLAERGWPRLGRWVGGVFVVTLLVSSVTGGNLFQAWNVAEVTHTYFGVPKLLTGVVLCALVGAVILGGIRRIGSVAGRLVPTMCLLYLVAAIVVVACNWDAVPAAFEAIFVGAFGELEREGAFLGGTAGYAFYWGMKRALFSSEVGQGSSPIAHCAARTDEPVREGIVAGLEPFIDTLVVCTLTALVLLTSGVWNRDVEVAFVSPPASVATESGTWSLAATPIVENADIARIDRAVFTMVRGDTNPDTGNELHRLPGIITRSAAGLQIEWQAVASAKAIAPATDGAWLDYRGASLTACAFDRTWDGLGKWLVTVAAWLFALSTMISWSYYGEQGVVFLWGARGVRYYKAIYCALIVVATIPWLIRSDRELDALTSVGTGVMLWANLPVLLVFAGVTMRAYRRYVTNLRRSGGRD